ncbi:MAG: N-acetyltransferase [Caldimonas sp.]
MSQNLAAAPTARNPGVTHADFRHASEAIARWTPSDIVDDIAESEDEFQNEFKIRVANNSSWRNRASSLIQRRYAWRGYSTSPLECDPCGRVTLSACVEDTTVATITAGLDSPQGMYVARLYPDEIQALRDEGRKLCEFTKLAVDESVRSHAVLGAIFHVACMYVINLHQCTDVLIEVNPRHVRFYQRMLGFKRAAEQRLDPEVNAPAVLLRLDLEHCATEIARLGGRRSSGEGERSFYPFFFAPDEAVRIIGRLRGHGH